MATGELACQRPGRVGGDGRAREAAGVPGADLLNQAVGQVAPAGLPGGRR
jgi:hypothetical protein